ncbi:Cyanovirin-N [Aspergillus parasiticus]|uniref:Cyanovirin-N n=1 Tax=Aspergillus parasiticus TaxID=5067 RepID=A0A5N6DH68_ASPPA|nr:Cyanovirin-N [Aspergillus parasiticus]
MAGNFHASAENVRLDGPVLSARLLNANGNWEDANIDLNGCIGNEDGRFVWERENWFGTAEDVELRFEGPENAPILRALLRDRDGQLVPADINLGERLGNVDGHFEFQFVSCTNLDILRPNY